MFTGIIEEVGEVYSINKGTKSCSLTIKAKKIMQDIKLGDSICTNGVCLTVTSFNNNYFTLDVTPETIFRTNLNKLSVGDFVNLERALSLTSRLGGHIVLGHVDGVGVIESIKREENGLFIEIKAPSNILKYTVEKGSIAIDGISLTISSLSEHSFTVCVIPHTKEETTLIYKKVGHSVNLECDIMGKYIEKFLLKEDREQKDSKVDLNFLSKHGFC